MFVCLFELAIFKNGLQSLALHMGTNKICLQHSLMTDFYVVHLSKPLSVAVVAFYVFAESSATKTFAATAGTKRGGAGGEFA